jgi:hypothetical protein
MAQTHKFQNLMTQAAVLLACGGSIRHTAKKLGVSEKTGIADTRRVLLKINTRWRRGRSTWNSAPNDSRRWPRKTRCWHRSSAGNTGLVKWRYRTSNLGDQGYLRVVDYEFDSALCAEMRALEEHAGTLTAPGNSSPW